MSTLALRVAFAFVLSLFASAASAASFDCAKAATATENAICATPALSDLDVQMATLFAVRMELPMLMGSRGAARDEQHDFLATRDACGADTACLTAAYAARIAALKATISDAMDDYCVKLGICG